MTFETFLSNLLHFIVEGAHKIFTNQIKMSRLFKSFETWAKFSWEFDEQCL